MKKKAKIVSVALLFIMIFALTLSVHAFDANVEGQLEKYAETVMDGSQRMEQTQWHFRNNNGVLEMRLFSITRGIWITEWMRAN
ncbi:MAG: hypothetical protein FWC75_02480 [Oscillospiraceae bacterium]|nr:hypothetical protein [Oscillospiraceae bacterium]